MESKKFDDVSGFLKKKKGSGFCRIFGNTNLRWFELQFDSKVFGYKKTKTDKIFKESYSFNEIIDYINQLPQEEKNKCDWRFGFQLTTKKKKFTLYTQTEAELKKWTYGFNIMLKRIPEAFPLIKSIIFKKALDYFEKPYKEELQRKKMQEEKERKEKEKERKRKLKEEEELRIRLKIEEEQRLKQKQEEEELDRKRKLLEDQDRIRKQREEQELLKEKLEEEKLKKRLYDQRHQSIISEIDEQILYFDDKKDANIYPKEDQLNKSLNRSLNNSGLNFKEDLDDWNFYDDLDQKIEENELIMFNPINKEIQDKIKRKKMEEEENNKGMKGVKNLFKNTQETMNFNAPIVLNITSTKQDFTKTKEKEETQSRIETHPQNSSMIDLNIDQSYTDYKVAETRIVNTKVDTMETIHQLPSDKIDENKPKYKKPRYFKKKVGDVSQLTNNTSLYNEDLNEKTSNHVDPTKGQLLMSNVTLNAFEMNTGKIFKEQEEQMIKDKNIEIKKKDDKGLKVSLAVEGVLSKPNNPHFNYVTNPNKFAKEEILEIDSFKEEKDNWFNENRLNNSTNDINKKLGNKLTMDLGDSFNDMFDKKNFSYNYGESDSDMNLSLGNLSQKKVELNNSFNKNYNMNANLDLNNSISNNIKNDQDDIEYFERIKPNNQKPNRKRSNVFENLLDDEDEFDQILKNKSVVNKPAKTQTNNFPQVNNEKKAVKSNIATNKIKLKDEVADKEKLKNNIVLEKQPANNDHPILMLEDSFKNNYNNNYNSNVVLSQENYSGNEFSFDNKDNSKNHDYDSIHKSNMNNDHNYKSSNLNGSFVEDFENW